MPTHGRRCPTAAAGRRSRRTSPRSSRRSSTSPAAGRPPSRTCKEPRGAAVDDRGRALDRGLRALAPARLRRRRRLPRRLGRARRRRVRLRELCGVAIARRRPLRRRHLERARPGLHPRGAFRASRRGALRAARRRGRAGRTRLGHRHGEPPRRLLRRAPRRTRRSSAARARARTSSRARSASPPRPSGVIYVADTGNRRIQVLGPDGAFRRRIAFPGWARTSNPTSRWTTTARSTPPSPPATPCSRSSPTGASCAAGRGGRRRPGSSRTRPVSRSTGKIVSSTSSTPATLRLEEFPLCRDRRTP